MSQTIYHTGSYERQSVSSSALPREIGCPRMCACSCGPPAAPCSVTGHRTGGYPQNCMCTCDYNYMNLLVNTAHTYEHISTVAVTNQGVACWYCCTAAAPPGCCCNGGFELEGSEVIRGIKVVSSFKRMCTSTYFRKGLRMMLFIFV